MTLLSIDASSKKTGYALFENTQLVDFGLWRYEGKDDNWRDRIKWMGTQLSTYIKSHKINHIVVEDVPPTSTVNNSQTVKVLSALQGYIIAIGVMENIEVTFLPVRTWKLHMGMDLTHSKEYQSFKKQYPNLVKFNKDKVKHYEKYMSIVNANRFIETEKQLIWKGASSKYTQDDIADAINIGLFSVHEDTKDIKYCDKTFNDILSEIYN